MRFDIRMQRGMNDVPLIAVVAIVAIVAIAAGAGFYFGTRQAPQERGVQGPVAPAVAPAAPVAADAAARKPLYWHDPMTPGQRFDKPGKSPFMDMDLVPVYADAAPEGGVAVSARQQQNFGVRTAAATEGTLDTGFTAVGVVGIDERGLVAVQARSPGYVERLFVRAQYDVVAAGQPLAELFVPEWLSAQEELLALKASPMQDASRLADAARNRLALLGMPAAEIARVERDGRASARVTVAAPQSGIVWEIGARDGMAVMPGTTLFKLAGIGTVWVTADVPEAQASLVLPGARVEARAAAYPDRAFKGSVGALLPEVNAQTRTVRARIVLANAGGALKPGMFATVKFGGAADKPSVLVPTEAVISTGKRMVVVVDAGDGRFVPVDVEVGRESGDVTEIRKGLSVGQRVVVSGQFLIDSEASLKGALAKISADSDKVAQAGAPKVAVHKAEGVVRSVGADVLIKHGAIPTAGMGAMTMAFKAPEGGVPKDIKEGTAVAFEFVFTPQGDMQLTSIVPAAAKK